MFDIKIFSNEFAKLFACSFKSIDDDEFVLLLLLFVVVVLAVVVLNLLAMLLFVVVFTDESFWLIFVIKLLKK
jgi:hypothetical protein